MYVCVLLCVCVCVGKYQHQQVFKEPQHSDAHTGTLIVRNNKQVVQEQLNSPATLQIIAMAQAYYPSQTVSPVKPALHESVFGGLHGDKQLNVEDVQEAYVENKDR